MPNHVTNWVHISGDPQKLADLKARLNTGETEFDFNAIIPRPPSLDITSGTSTDEGMAALSDQYFARYGYGDEWMEKRFDGKVKTRQDLENYLKEHRPDSLREGQIALDNLKQYGVKDWYDWGCREWGTKWNAYSVELLAENKNELFYRFDTAWSSPTPIFDAIVNEGFEVDVFWSDEGGPSGDYGDPWSFFDIDTSPRVSIAN